MKALLLCLILVLFGNAQNYQILFGQNITTAREFGVGTLFVDDFLLVDAPGDHTHVWGQVFVFRRDQNGQFFLIQTINRPDGSQNVVDEVRNLGFSIEVGSLENFSGLKEIRSQLEPVTYRAFISTRKQ